jgi:hypothetical protein
MLPNCYQPFEKVIVVADGHCQGQEFLQRLPRFVEVDRNATRLDLNALRECLDFLVHDPHRGFDQNLGAFEAVAAESVEKFGDFPAADALIVDLVAGGQAAQMVNKDIAVDQAARADMVGDAGGHDLLRPPSTDAEEGFDGCAIDERAGKGLEVINNDVEMGEPDWFSGHGFSTMLVRRCA